MYVASAPQRRPRKPAQPQAGQADSNRDSNALRASVLDAALAIGIGTSRTVENWMFNTVDEEDEEAETMFSPGLTSATSDESTPSPYTPVTPPIERDVHQFIPPSPSKVFPVPPPPMQSPAVQPPLDHKQRNKLRKKAKDADGYISDDHARKAAKKKSKDTVNAESSADEGGGYFSDFGRRKKTRTKKKDKAQAQMAVEGAGDESDGGYLSEASKKKRGFFRLKSKSSKVSVASPLPPPVPSLPPAPSPSSLPIAGRFVKSPEPPIHDERSRSTTPLAHQRTNASVDSISSVDEPELDTPSTSLSGHIYTANQLDASPATKKGVRFTPSTRFSGPAPAPSAAATPSLDEMPPPQHLGLPPQRPYISDTRSLSPTRRFAPSPTASDFSLVSQSDFVEPSTAYVVPSPSASPVPPPATLYDTSTVVDVPRPSHLRVNLPSPSRSRFSIPPPTPPPTGPLPDIPVSEGPAVTVYSPSPISASQPQPQEAFRFPPPPSAFSRSTSPLPRPGSASLLPRGASPSPSLFGQSIPPIARGRESPFPSRPILPQEESTALVRRTSVTHRRPMIAVEDEHGIIRTASLDDVGTARGRSLAGRSTTPYSSEDTSMRRDISHGVTYDPQPRARMHAPTVIPPNEDDVRSDVALFFFPPGKGEGEALSPYHSRIAPESVYSDSLVEGARTSFADDASVYPPTMKTRGTVDSYYFGGGTGSRPGSFIDDERSSELRSRFVNNVGRMWTDSSAPPVPSLPKGVGPAF